MTSKIYIWLSYIILHVKYPHIYPKYFDTLPYLSYILNNN